MSLPTSPIEASVVLPKLRGLLFALLAQNSAAPFATAESIPSDANLSTVGIASIDFLEFALSVEKEFGVSVLDTIEPNDLPQTLDDWRQHVCAQLDNRRA